MNCVSVLDILFIEPLNGKIDEFLSSQLTRMRQLVILASTACHFVVSIINNNRKTGLNVVALVNRF